MRTFDPDEYDRWLERFKRKKACNATGHDLPELK